MNREAPPTPGAGRTISVGVIGIGFGQNVHVPALRSDPRCVITAICASNLGRARKVADRLKIPRAYGDAHALIEDPQIDAISIAVPPHQQPALIEAAAAAGKHVFCEKPVGADLESVVRAQAAVQRAKVNHAVDFMFPEIPAWQKAKELLDGGLLGPLRHVAVSWHLETYAYRMGLTDSWKVRSAGGGGTLNSFGSHCLYSIEWFLGRIARLTARLSPPPRDNRSEARFHGWLEMEDGTPVSVSLAADAFLGGGHRLEFYGESGTLVLSNATPDYVNGFELLLGRRDDPKLVLLMQEDTATGDGRVTAVSQILQRFFDGIAQGKAVLPGLAEGLRVQSLLEAARRADRAGQWQNV